MTHGRAFRFLHASDLLLDVPLAGPVDLSPPLRKRLAEAPYRSAAAVFTTAIEERVDFVLLAGGTVNLDQASPSEVHFLVQQFQRLAQHSIPVYWAGSATDGPSSWPPQHRLPANVHHVPVGDPYDTHPDGTPRSVATGVAAKGRWGCKAHTLVIERGGVAIARLVSVSRQPQQRLAEIHLSPARHPAPITTIGLLHLRRDEESTALAEIAGFDYWALGGRITAEENTRELGLPPIRFCGSPVGRTLEHVEARGCTLVTVDDAGLHTRTLSTASASWHLEKVEVNFGDTLEAIELRVRNRCQQLLSGSTDGVDRIVSWRLFGPHAVLHRARVQNWDTQLTQRLQQSYGTQTPAIWSRAVEFQPAISVTAESYPTDSVTAAYLRSVTDHRRGDRLNLEPYRNETPHVLPAEVAYLDGPRHVEHLLNEAAVLGAEFLQNKEAC